MHSLTFSLASSSNTFSPRQRCRRCNNLLVDRCNLKTENIPFIDIDGMITSDIAIVHWSRSIKLKTRCELNLIPQGTWDYIDYRARMPIGKSLNDNDIETEVNREFPQIR